MQIISARIDSVAISGTETSYFAMRQIRTDDNGCYTPQGASWLGDVVKQDAEGNFHFIFHPLSPSDSAYKYLIKSGAALGIPWRFYNLHTIDHYIEAEVTQISLLTFIGISDSVKIITLQRKNAAGQNVSDPINGQKILLSKNYGLIRVPKFDEFNETLVFYGLCGKTNPVTGRTLLTFEEIFDFQPGDEFHIQYKNSNYALFYPTESGSIIRQVLDRITSSNSDTITYKIAECKSSCFFPEMNQFTILNTQDTFNVTYIKSNFPALAYEPYEPQITNYGMQELNANHMGLSATGSLEKAGIPWTQAEASWPLWTDGSGVCWYNAIIDDFVNSYYYYKGLGGPYHNTMGIINSDYYNLTYYKKGTETWGSPFNCDVLMHTGIDESVKSSLFRLFPNPATGLITVTSQLQNQLPAVFQLYDNTGRMILERRLLNQTEEVTLEKCAPGCYFYRWIPQSGDVITGKLIRQ